MRNDHTPAEKAQIAMGAGFSMALAVRLLVRFTDNPTAQIAAACVALIAAALICYGIGQFAVSKGRSAAWGFTGFVGYILLRFVLKPKPVFSASPDFAQTIGTTSPPGLSPTNY